VSGSPGGQPPAPYKKTPVFDQDSLPAALRSRHSTKAGVWGLIRVLEGALRYVIEAPASEEILTPGRCGFVLPEQLHFVEPLGPVRMQVEFYREPPLPV
jgi:tellurite resistance-related uncharacterized protein